MLVNFELPRVECELPHHSVTHGGAHGAIHMHHAIHGPIRMAMQGGMHTLIILLRSLVCRPLKHPIIGQIIMLQTLHKAVHHAVQSLCA